VIRWLQVLGLAVGVWVLAVNFHRAWGELTRETFEFSEPRALAATGLLAVTYGGFAWLWRAIARELGTVVPYLTTIQFWAFSNLGRYVPGKIWQITGVMLVASDLGVAPGLAATVGVLAVAFMAATGCLVGLGFLPDLFASDRLRVAALVLSGASLALPLVWPGSLRKGLARLQRVLGRAAIGAPSRRGIARLTAYFLVGWLAHGAVFFVFCSSFVPVSWVQLAGVTGSFSIAYVTGLVAVFAPGGIGVREEVLASTLGHVLPGAPVHVIAVAARVWTMAAEVLVLALAMGLRIRGRGAPR